MAVTLLLCSACELKFKPNEEAEAAVLSVQRYDRLESRYLTTGDFSALQQMNTDYPIETRTLIEKMLQLGTITDANISNRFLMFYQDSLHCRRLLPMLRLSMPIWMISTSS